MYYKLKGWQVQALKGALNKKSPWDLFKKESWSSWSKFLKNTVKVLILVKKNFFLYIFPEFNHKFQSIIFFYSLSGNTFQ